MIRALTRLTLRIRLWLVHVETAQAEAAQRDIPRRLEELSQQEKKLTTAINAGLPIAYPNITA